MAESQAPARPKATPKATPPPRGFEATCPTCGMTADVGAEAEHVRCRRCGTVIRLVDHAVPPAPPAAPAAAPVTAGGRRVAAANPGGALAVGLAGPLVVLLLFGIGHAALDQPSPDQGGAGVALLLTVLAAAGAVLAQGPLLGSGQALPRALWGLLPAVPALWLGVAAGTAYDDGGLAWAFFGLPILLAYLVAVGVTAALQARSAEGGGSAAVLIAGAGLCLGFGLAAAYLLMTLDQQAQAAREAHEAPAWGFLLVAGTMLGLAAWRRR